MKVALDAMGGDLAPAVNVEGAIEAVSENRSIRVILVGDESAISRELKDRKYSSDRITIQPASEVVTMDESPSIAIRKKKNSSIHVGVRLVQSGEADGFVSAGHSGVVMATSLLFLGKSKGVDRPAIATVMPAIKGAFILLDVGATVDCKPENLLQFALMGNTYCRMIMGKENPRVALLSIGEEDIKGNEMTKEAFKLIEKTDVKFIRNIEGKDIFTGKADVIVCDGFTGNIALKVSEGLAEAILQMLKKEISTGSVGKIGYLLIRPAIRNFKKRTDYDEYGGAPLLGINGTSIISHGRSSAKAIKNAVTVASSFSEKKVHEAIATAIASDLQEREQTVS
jgi:glycerol-3-phosphate acyltransferase PlsX